MHVFFSKENKRARLLRERADERQKRRIAKEAKRAALLIEWGKTSSPPRPVGVKVLRYIPVYKGSPPPHGLTIIYCLSKS